MTTKERVAELMKGEGLDYKDEVLVLKISVIYVNAQQDLLQESLKETK